MSFAKAFGLGAIATLFLVWLAPFVLGAVFFGLALLGAAAIVRKLFPVGEAPNLSVDKTEKLKRAKKVNPDARLKL